MAKGRRTPGTVILNVDDAVTLGMGRRGSIQIRINSELETPRLNSALSVKLTAHQSSEVKRPLGPKGLVQNHSVLYFKICMLEDVGN